MGANGDARLQHGGWSPKWRVVKVANRPVQPFPTAPQSPEFRSRPASWITTTAVDSQTIASPAAWSQHPIEPRPTSLPRYSTIR